MASIRKRGSTWYVRIHDASRSPKRKEVPFPAEAYTRRQIEAKAAELVYKMSEGEWNPWDDPHPSRVAAGSTWTVEEAVRRYCEHKRRLGRRSQRGGWSEGTWRRYRSHLSAFARRHSGRAVEALTTEDFEDWIFRPGIAEATQRMYRRQMKTFVRWLREEAGAEHVADLPRPMRPPRRRSRDYPTEEDLRQVVRSHRELLIEKTRRKHVPKAGPKSPLARWGYSMAYRLAFYQGLRLKEIVNLVPAAVDLGAQRVAIGLGYVPKGRHEAVITITPPAYPILKHLSRRAPAPDAPLFGLDRGRRISDAFREARRRVFPAREKINFHSLRRGATIYWLERGVLPRDMQNILRHASITTLERHYDQYLPDATRGRINAIAGDPTEEDARE